MWGEIFFLIAEREGGCLEMKNVADGKGCSRSIMGELMGGVGNGRKNY